MCVIPLCPEVADRLALEDSRKDIDQAKDAYKYNGNPEASPNALCGKDPEIEENHRQLKEGL
jgi:hypothetical protein